MSDDFITQMQGYQTRISDFLNSLLQPDKQPQTNIHQYAPHLLSAMHYAVLNGGKRIRPLLVYAAALAVSKPLGEEQASASKTSVSQSSKQHTALNYVAAAVEYIHCYSLVHDDLPAMDDDDLRRGKPTCHKQFDEATAILVGDALQTEAFNLLLKSSDNDTLRIKLIQSLTNAASVNGLIGGQAIDLAATNKSIDLQHLQTMHQLKTGALIRASVNLGALCGGADQAQLQALDDYASAIGLAFQIQDDILDIESSSEILGKAQGSDIANNKSTYPSLLGVDKAKAMMNELLNQAFNSLQPFGESANFLGDLANFIVKREFLKFSLRIYNKITYNEQLAPD